MKILILDTENDNVKEICRKYCNVIAERSGDMFMVGSVRDLASWNRVLVTDDNTTAAEFRSGGGEAIVVPHEGNHLKDIDPVDWVLKNMM